MYNCAGGRAQPILVPIFLELLCGTRYMYDYEYPGTCIYISNGATEVYTLSHMMYLHLQPLIVATVSLEIFMEHI